MTKQSPITILHISDIQFGHNHRFGRLALGDPDATFDTLLTRLTLDLDQLDNDHDLKPDLLVVSGDLAEWGRKSEFDDVATFLAKLSEHLNLPRRRVIVVPGNHDVNRAACQSYFVPHANNRAPAHRVTRSIFHQRASHQQIHRVTMFDRMHPQQRWHVAHGGPPLAD